MKYCSLLEWGLFIKFPVQAKLSFSPYACCVHARGGRESFFFSRLAALCMVLLGRFKILLGLWISGIENPFIFGGDRAILVRPDKVAKSTQTSLKRCIHRLIAGSQLALKEFYDWFSYFQVTLMHPLKSNFKSMTLVHNTPNST